MALKAKVSDDAFRRFDSFLELANIGDLTHPKDMGRWRDFVIQTHIDKTELNDTDISDAILERYPHSSKAVEMGGRFCDERDLLDHYDKRRGDA